MEGTAVTILIDGSSDALLAEVEMLAQQLGSPTDSGARRQVLARRLATQDALAAQLEVLLAGAVRKRDQKGATFLSKMLTAATSRIATLSNAHASDQLPRGRPIVVVGSANAVAIDARQGGR